MALASLYHALQGTYALASTKRAKSNGGKCESLSVHVPAFRENKSMVKENIERIKRVLKPDEVILIVGSDEVDEYSELRGVKVIGGAEKGKANALNEALKLTSSDCVIVFDADSYPDEGFEVKCSRYSASNWRGYYVVENRWSESLKVVTDLASKVLLNGRKALGLKVLAPGSGVCVKREVLEAVKWPEELTEDLALGVKLSALGIEADLNEGTVAVEVPSSYFDLKRQQERWNYGAIRSLKFLKIRNLSDLELVLYLTQYSQTWLPLLALAASPLGLSPWALLLYYSSLLFQTFALRKACRAHGIKCRIKDLSRASVAGLTMSISLLSSTVKALLKVPLKWKVTPKGGKRGEGEFKEEYLLLLTPLLVPLNVLSLPLALQYFTSTLFVMKSSK